MIVGTFGGTLAIVIAFSVPPNNPTIPWSVTFDPGHHSFPKWVIVPTTSWTKANASLRLTKWFLIAQLLLLCAGDVSLNPGPSGLKFCHWNVQRLTDSKLEELKLFVTNLHSDVDALIITETFCQPKIPDSYYSIPGFNLHRKDRVGKSGGGIMAWIRNSLEHKRRMDLESDIVEALWLEVFPYKSKRSLLTAGVYRPPSNNAEQDKMLGINIENAYLLNKEMILLGDFNVNVLSYIDFKKHHLVKILHSLNLTQVVNSITRPLSKTCLDHIWCSHPEHLNNISVIPSGMSDHLPIVATRKYNRARSNNSRYNAISYRDIKNLDKDAFVESLETAPWDCAFVFDDINDIVDAWYKILKAVVNEHLPLKQKRVKRRNQPKWFNANILKEIRTRDNSLKKARKSNLERDWDLYKRANNNVSSLIRRTKQAYFKNKISENKNNTRKLWNLIEFVT